LSTVLGDTNMVDSGLGFELDHQHAPQRSSWPRYEDDEIAAVTEVLRSGRVNSLHHGERCRAFEAALAKRLALPHAIAVSNGTAALELALKALGVGAGDEVVVPARSFMASASCVVTCGAVPVFADIDRDSQNLTATTIEAVLTARSKAIVVVHLAGWPCEMDAIMELARRRNLLVIEDCAQSLGAMLGGRPAGSFGDAAALSFCTDKIISTGGEGGALLFKDRAAWKAAWALKDHGKDPDHYAALRPGPEFLWLHQSVGSNARMTEMQAAIGCTQLAKLDGWLARRGANSAALEAQLQGLAALRLASPGAEVRHARYKYYAFVRTERLKPDWSRRRIIEAATSQGLAVSTGSCPEIYLEAAFASSRSRPAQRLPVASELGGTSLMLAIDHTLEPSDLGLTGRKLRAIIEGATV
jgi:dTDP-4-amino-4,6-dideoxygalactose transaminase